jgi:hypothetical protein
MANQLTTTEKQLDIANKRRLVFGSFMLYAPETGALRERAMEHTVLAALVGSSSESRMKNGNIQQHLRLGSAGTILQPEIILKTLKSLEAKGLVDETADDLGKPGYFLTTEGMEQANREVGRVSALLNPVLDEMLQHTNHVIPQELGKRVCTDFICSVFTQLGSSIAAYVGGQQPQVGNGHFINALAEQIANRYELSAEVKESIIARCVALLKSESPATRKLIFHLTQGYYFAQLLGMDKSGFNPIAEQAFANAIFYCDTNVLFAGLLPGDHGRSFEQVVRLSQRCGIDLRVTRATVDEARHVASEKLLTLKQIDGPVPPSIAELSSDEFVRAFFEMKRTNESLSPEEFMSDFIDIAELVNSKWKIALDESNEDEMIAGSDTGILEQTLQDAIISIRGWGKSAHVLKHDIAHYVFINKLRRTSSKSWFLTRDQLLIACAPALAKREKPKGEVFCFSMLGFLQSISPFIQSDTEDDVIAQFFSSLLEDQIFLSEKLFDGRELALMAEMHADVLATPTEVLVPAIDYIKHTILHGKAYHNSDIPRVSLELRKFLASSRDEKQAVLQQRTRELEHLNAEALAKLDREQKAIEDIGDELRDTRESLDAERVQSGVTRKRLSELELSESRRRATNEKLRVSALIGILILGALVTAHYDVLIEHDVVYKIVPEASEASCRWIVGALAVGLFLAPMAIITVRSPFSSGKRTAIVTLATCWWLFIFGVHASPNMGILADVVGVAAFAYIVAQAFEKKPEA